MRLGIGRMRLAPGVFWALTPFELALMTTPGAPEAVDAAALRTLMALDPDRGRAGAAQERT
jgi:uncharacterized phage protein (TIGR02216 family)